ncbi:MAG: putative Ig domain-containing protein, partial [Cyanobacteria bacterium MAG CAR1_bin_15]|nr:putative Ig domain-containing protein [Cyanobacteria bacterium MAG CAR1_bin_15]
MALPVAPTAEVTVAVASEDTDVATVSPTSLTFTSTTWSTAQMVTVTAVPDDIVNPSSRSVKITHTPSSTDDRFNSDHNAPEVMVTVQDDDTAGLAFVPASLTVDEGSSGSYTVALTSRPTGTVMVTVASNNTDVTVDTNSGSPGNQNTLSFTTTWDTGQTVTVAADEDDDTTNDSATLSHTAAGGGYNSVTGNLVVTVTDNDSPNTAPTVANIIADQSGRAGTAFSYAFPANTFADADSHTLSYTATRGDNSALPTWLTFNSRTFSGTPQSTDVGTLAVKVTADDSNGGTVSDTFNIVVSAAPPSLSISGGGAVTEGSDAVFTVTASVAQGSSQTVLYTLSAAPGADFLDDAREGDSNSFLFPRNETSFTLRIPTVGDSTAESSGSITVALRLRSSSNYVLGSPSSATVRVNDDDAQPVTPVNPVTPVVTLPRVSITAGTSPVTEGAAASFTLTVSPPPPTEETVTVNVQVSQSGSVVESGESGRRTVVV